MIDLELNQLKDLTAKLAEWTIGQVITCPDGSTKWDPASEYMKGVAPEGQSSPTHLTERKAIDWISRRLPAGALVVEVGTFIGGTAAVWANANPAIQVKAVDVYDLSQWLDILHIDQSHADTVHQQHIQPYLDGAWTVETLQKKFKHYPNLEFVKGVSPRDFVDSEFNNIDVYFEDSDHSNPGLAQNLDFWCSRVKSKGLVLLHDYAPYLPEVFVNLRGARVPTRYPDVETEVDRLIGLGYTLEGTVHSLAILRKP